MRRTDNGYICAKERELTHIRTEIKTSKGFKRTYEIYSSKDCSGCEIKSECLYKYDEDKHIDKNKTIKVNERWDALKRNQKKIS